MADVQKARKPFAREELRELLESRDYADIYEPDSDEQVISDAQL